MNKSSAIEVRQLGIGSHTGTHTMYIVHMYEDDALVESRLISGRSIHYANDVAQNWENGIIKTRKNLA